MSFKIAGAEVTHLTHDSRTVRAGSCFFALSGGTANGTMYVRNAIAKGAAVIVTGEKLDEPVPQLVVPNVREFMALASKRFHGDVCDKMEIIAVVGTNGKTTCAHILKHILGNKAETIGTLGPGNLTTPDPIELHAIFADMYLRGVRHVVIEVSAHAIHYCKVAGINFRTAIFTNISQDHLDFFGTMEKYAQTKVGFFGSAVQTAVVNADDPYGREIIAAHPNALKYSLVDAKGLKLAPVGSAFQYNGHRFNLNMAGQFNVYNALACILVAWDLGVRFTKIKRALKTLPPVPGRFNTFKTKSGATAIIDFAHTPDGLEKILASVREITAKDAKVICVFGCGGNRDKTKREIMGSIAARHSDFVVITSDNPRDEAPRAIMLQIEAGVKASTDKYCLKEKRDEAVKYALEMAQHGDMVVIAGKGAETTQEIAGKFIPYTDEHIVRQYTK